jgi:molybdopterin molybdotransferase
MTSDSEINQRIDRLTPLADVLDRVAAAVVPVAPREVSVAAAVGRVLAADVGGGVHPWVPLALRDGWAVASDLTVDASSYAPLPLADPVPVALGAPMPAGADAVAPLDLVEIRAGRAHILAPVCAGEGVLPAGSDIAGNSVLLGQGRRITRIVASVLSAAAHESVRIREPRLRLLQVGPASDAIVGATIDLIAGAIATLGGCTQRCVCSGGDELAAALAADDADAVIAIGGTGTGPTDCSVRVLARCGRVKVHGIALSPGETAAFGLVGSRPVLLLPGRLDAALTVWLVIGRRLLAALSGAVEEEPTIKAVLARKVSSTLGLAELVPVRLRDGAAEPIASGYLSWTALAQSEGWLLVPATSEGYPTGTEVMIRPWP